MVIVSVNRSANVVQLYDRHGQQIQDIPLPGYGVILCTSLSADFFTCRPYTQSCTILHIQWFLLAIFEF